MTYRPLCLCLTALSLFSAACGDDGGGDTADASTGHTAPATDTATPTTTDAADFSRPARRASAAAAPATPARTPSRPAAAASPTTPCSRPPTWARCSTPASSSTSTRPRFDGLLNAQGFGALAPVAYGADVDKIRYRTQDRGEAVEATGFVSYPTGDAVGERPVVVWAHGTTGFTDMCGPTAAPDGYVIPALLAAFGFVTVAPDYLGSTAGARPPASSTPTSSPSRPRSPPSTRCARWSASPATPASRSRPRPARTSSVGASEGGFATLWADRYAPYYAPEFKILANVASVPPTRPASPGTAPPCSARPPACSRPRWSAATTGTGSPIR